MMSAEREFIIGVLGRSSHGVRGKALLAVKGQRPLKLNTFPKIDSYFSHIPAVFPVRQARSCDNWDFVCCDFISFFCLSST